MQIKRFFSVLNILIITLFLSLAGFSIFFDFSSLVGFVTGDFGLQDVASSNGCGYVNSDLIITGNIITNGTCFIINASGIILDGGGFNISGNRTGFGVNVTGFHNITIKRLELNNFSIGIYLNNSFNTTVENNRINAPISISGV